MVVYCLQLHGLCVFVKFTYFPDSLDNHLEESGLHYLLKVCCHLVVLRLQTSANITNPVPCCITVIAAYWVTFPSITLSPSKRYLLDLLQ